MLMTIAVVQNHSEVNSGGQDFCDQPVYIYIHTFSDY